MKNIRRILAFMVVLCMALSLMTMVSAAEPEQSGAVGDSNVSWRLSDGGCLFIGGSGDAERFSSPADQPWAAFREEIREVWFEDMEMLAISDLAYWFTGCVNLTCAEVPYTTPLVGTEAFAGCLSLERIQFYYGDSDEFTIAPGAFAVGGTEVKTTVCVPADQQYGVIRVTTYDWAGDGRHIHPADVYGLQTLADCAIGTCTCTSCSFYYKYSSNGASGHTRYAACTGCSAYTFNGTEAHSGNPCSLCGYSSGGGGATPCYHTSTYTTWSGCTWYRYCQDCGTMVNYGVTHSSYVYGAWEYGDTAQHRRYASCSACGEGSYEYAAHTSAAKYDPYDGSQHIVTAYCPTCGGTLSTSYAPHNDGSGDGRCDACAHSMSAVIAWDLGDGNIQTTSQVYGQKLALPAQPSREGYTFLGWFTAESDGTQVTADTVYTAASPTTYYAHWELIPVFSVTVPVSLALTVSEQGEVYAASTAAIVNHSTAAVKVTGVTVTAVNGWTLVPYDTDMALEKVDSRLIGFSLKGSGTAGKGTTEALALGGEWTVPLDGSLPLTYDAVVSALSEPVDEQVASIVFILEWA